MKFYRSIMWTCGKDFAAKVYSLGLIPEAIFVGSG
jgi:hypothetical protein